jgi:RNA polymerase sigma factor (sigma-70 family)
VNDVDQLVIDNVKLAYHMAGKFARIAAMRGDDDDLVASALEGLVIAAHRFEPERGLAFSTYATFWIRNRMIRNVRETRHVFSQPNTGVSRKLTVPIRVAMERLRTELGREPTSEEVASAMNASKQTIANLLGFARHVYLHISPCDYHDENETGAVTLPTEAMSPEEAAVVESTRRSVRDVLGVLSERELEVVTCRYMVEDTETLADIGRRLGLTRERIRQVQEDAFAKLRREMAANGHKAA